MNHRRNGNGNGHHGPAKIPLGPVYERTNRRGDTYLVGRIGLMKLLVVQTGEISKGNQVWQAYVLEGPYVTEEQRLLAEALEDAQP